MLSDTLRVIRLAGAVFLTARLASPWAIASPPPETLAQYVDGPSEGIALFHIVVEGACYISIAGEVIATIAAGEVVIFPHGSAHVMGSAPHLKPTPLNKLLPSPPFHGIPEITLGPQSNADRFICGYLHCNQQFLPLIGALPRVLLVQNRELKRPRRQHMTPPALLNSASVELDDWLEATLRFMMNEAVAEQQGNEAMLIRLTEILYVEILRRYMQTLPSTKHGWLAGVRDPLIGQTLRLLHAHPERAWTVEALADAVACSRSTLAQRFTLIIGESPIQYLAAWRMHLAQHLLKQTSMNIKAIAGRVGYDSEAAFNRAFKRHLGIPPATWRMKDVS